jgi:carboxymethylenebutenolidase
MNDELKSLLPKTDFTRREFVVTSVTAGFALATQPIAAQTVITTDTAGLIAGEVKIPASDIEIPAYRALPAKGKSFPVVLVVQEIFGVHEHIKDLCRRLAKVGYLAIAPQMYARQGDVASLTNIQEIVGKVVSKVPDSQVMSDLDAAVVWAGKNNGNTNKLAITGFCWGGRVVWLYAAHNPKLKAGAAWYGRLVGAASELTPKHPIDVVAQIKAPVLGLYGATDTGIPVDTVEKMKAAIAGQKGKSEIILYPDTPHGFNADYRESYRPTQAKEAWAKMLAWFKQNGAA